MGRVLLTAFGQCRRDNLIPIIHANVQFLPALALLLLVFLRVPFPLTTDFQTRTVDDEAERFLRGPIVLVLCQIIWPFRQIRLPMTG